MFKFILFILVTISAKSYGGDFRVGIGLGSGDVSLTSNLRTELEFAEQKPMAMALDLG